MTEANNTSLHSINQMNVDTPASLITRYGVDKIKAGLAMQSVAVVVEDITLAFRAYMRDLIPGRDLHDAKLREMAICKDQVRQHVESIRDTGKMIGQLPDNLPQAKSYTNLFQYLGELVDAIKTQAPENTLLRNPHCIRGWEAPEFQDYLAEIHGADFPKFLGELAGSKVGNDYSRAQFMAPHRYRDWASVGESVYGLLIGTEGRSAALAKAIRAKLDAMVAPFYSRRNCVELLPALACTLLTEADAELLVAAGWSDKHSDNMYAALTDSKMYREGKGSRVQTVESLAVQFNISRLSEVLRLKLKAESAAALLAQREEQEAASLEVRKVEAAARLALQEKIKDGTVTAAELDAAGY